MDPIIDGMLAFGYPADIRGICFGIAMMAEESLQTGNYPEFIEIMNYLLALKMDAKTELKKRVKLAELRQARIAQAKRDNAKFLPSPLTDEEILLLKIKTFFFRLSFYQYPHKIMRFLDMKGASFTQLETHKVEAQLQKKWAEKKEENAKEQGIPTPLLSQPEGILFLMNPDNGEAIFEQFSEAVIAAQESVHFVILSKGHAMHLLYEASNKTWHLTDHSQLKTFTSPSELFHYLDENEGNEHFLNLKFLHYPSGDQLKKKVLINKLSDLSRISVEVFNVQGLDVNCLRDLFLMLVQAKEFEVIKNLVNQGADTSAFFLKDEESPSCFLTAVSEGSLDIVDYILTYKPQEYDINDEEFDGCNSLSAAAKGGYLNLVRLLLSHGALVSGKESSLNPSPLHRACQYGHFEVASHLVEQHADIYAETLNKRMPIHAAAKGGYVDLVAYLLDHFAEVESLDQDGFTPLCLASQFGQTAVLKLLLEREARAWDKTFNGSRPIHLAAEQGQLATVRILLQQESKDADIDVPDKEGNTALHLACREGHQELIRYLLEQGADPNKQNSQGCTALHFAASAGELGVLSLLLDSRKINDINQKAEPLGLTPLECAAEKGHFEVVAKLFEHPELHLNEAIESLQSRQNCFAEQAWCILMGNALSQAGKNAESVLYYSEALLLGSFDDSEPAVLAERNIEKIIKMPDLELESEDRQNFLAYLRSRASQGRSDFSFLNTFPVNDDEFMQKRVQSNLPAMKGKS